MGDLRISGISSGIDTEGLIQQLMAIERRPQVLMQRRVEILGWQKDYWNEINTKLLTLQTAVGNLFNRDKLVAHAATSSDESYLTATASGVAQVGQYEITVKQLATATKIVSGNGVAGLGLGKAVDPTLVITEAKFGTPVTLGTFTINGKVISVEAGDTLNSVINKINTAGAGVTASYDATTDTLKIKANSLGGPLNFGALGDTSNFLSAAGLIAAPETNTGTENYKESVIHLGAVNPRAYLKDANFATAVTGDVDGKGEFKINGVSINYNINEDTLQEVLDRINASAAGVTATYDRNVDRIILTAKNTGSMAISLADVTGNFLTATDLVGTSEGGTGTRTETLGQNAAVVVNGLNNNQPIYRTSNTISDLLPGVTLNLKKVHAATDPPVTLTVGLDKKTIKAAIKEFVDKFNDAMGLINTRLTEKTVTDKSWENMTITERKQGILSRDSALRDIRFGLTDKVSGVIKGLDASFDQLADLGITLTTGPSGGTLSLDEAKLDAAITANPEAVARLFFNDADGDGVVDKDAKGNPIEVGVAVTLDKYLADLLNTKTASYAGTSFKSGMIPRQQDVLADQIKSLQGRIDDMETRLKEREEYLVRQFTAMEQALAQMQSQSAWLSAQLAGLQAWRI